jgi:hypothetical protein
MTRTGLRLATAVFASCCPFAIVSAQDQARRELRVAPATGPITLDGRLDERDWATAPTAGAFRTLDPVEDGEPHGQTEVRVLADRTHLWFGIRCFDPEPAGIVSWAVARDAQLDTEDHVKLAFGTLHDGRSGYVFAVNPRGARYDALIAERGESENPDWDGTWAAATRVDEFGWTIEIELPVATLAFAADGAGWDFNVERRVQRLLERSRWVNPRRDQQVTNMALAGSLTGLPQFDLGLGLTLRPALVLKAGRPSSSEPHEEKVEPTLDALWRITPQLTGALTINTDFAETEADQRRINLTRFPLFFPEKRTFFREGADVYEYGIGLDEEFLPFQSRRIGLVNGEQVPLQIGAKVSGRIGNTTVGGLVTRMGDEPGVAPETTLGVVRVRQDVLEESNVGIIATAGDPLGRNGSALIGADATFQTSRAFGSHNLLFGVWGAKTTREDLDGSPSAWGFKLDYPNDEWNPNVSWKHFDEGFDPSLAFVRRSGVDHFHTGVDHVVRPENGWLRKQTFETGFDLYVDLDGHWSSYEAFLSPINALFESGDGFEFNVIPTGERLLQNFEIADGVVLTPGKYEWVQYRVAATAAEKRPVAAEVAYTFGPFYDGTLDRWSVDARGVVSSWLTLRAGVDSARGHLPAGDFIEDVYNLRISFTFSSDLTLDSFVQYDTESRLMGTNTRLRWDITPMSQVFLIFNHNSITEDGALHTDGYETVLKLVHEIRL